MTTAEVLLVEDHPDARDALRLLLELRGYSVATAADGAEALRLLRDGVRPCVILLDWMMPNLDVQRSASRSARCPMRRASRSPCSPRRTPAAPRRDGSDLHNASRSRSTRSASSDSLTINAPLGKRQAVRLVDGDKAVHVHRLRQDVGDAELRRFVTWVRGAPSLSATAVPHSGKTSLAGSSVWQGTQLTASDPPHSRQNRASAGFSWPQGGSITTRAI